MCLKNTDILCKRFNNHASAPHDTFLLIYLIMLSLLESHVHLLDKARPGFGWF